LLHSFFIWAFIAIRWYFTSHSKFICFIIEPNYFLGRWRSFFHM